MNKVFFKLMDFNIDKSKLGNLDDVYSIFIKFGIIEKVFIKTLCYKRRRSVGYIVFKDIISVTNALESTILYQNNKAFI
jgi:hypothetical protein